MAEKHRTISTSPIYYEMHRIIQLIHPPATYYKDHMRRVKVVNTGYKVSQVDYIVGYVVLSRMRFFCLGRLVLATDAVD